MRELSRQQRASAVASLLVAMSLSLAACQSGEASWATGSGVGATVTARTTPVVAPEAGRPSASGSASLADQARLPGADFASPVELVWQADGGPHRLRLPTGLAVDRDGTVTVVDAGHDRLVRLSGAGQILARLGSQGSRPGEFLFGPPPDEAGRASGLVGGGVAVDADGAIFVADPLNARIQRLDRTGQVVATWADAGPAGGGQREAEVFDLVAAGRLARPAGIAVDDRQGRVYVADRATHRIHAFDLAGRWLLAWGELGLAAGQFLSPVAVAVDRQGQVYVADRDNHRIQKFDGSGRFLTAWGGFGTQAGEFMAPGGVVVDQMGHVYVADTWRVQVFTDVGVALGVWGSPGGGASEFLPAGIAVDDQGAIYVTDQGRHRVVKFRPRQPWPTPVAAQPTPRPTVPIPTPAPPAPSPASVTMTPTDR